jgi:hypothetical protein
MREKLALKEKLGVKKAKVQASLNDGDVNKGDI